MVGLVRPENISWNERVNPKEAYDSSQVGKEIEVVILNVIPNTKRIALGIKQISEDPWKNIVSNYKSNESVITSKIAEISKAGLLIEIQDGILGHYRQRDLSIDKDEDLTNKFNVGDEITGLVTGFDKNKRQVNMSQTKLLEKEEKDQLSDFVASQGESSLKLGDILNEKLKTLD